MKFLEPSKENRSKNSVLPVSVVVGKDPFAEWDVSRRSKTQLFCKVKKKKVWRQILLAGSPGTETVKVPCSTADFNKNIDLLFLVVVNGPYGRRNRFSASQVQPGLIFVQFSGSSCTGRKCHFHESLLFLQLSISYSRVTLASKYQGRQGYKLGSHQGLVVSGYFWPRCLKDLCL
jgi:hypothetical protein